MEPEAARGVFQTLFGAYGPQHWWPADSPFEVMVGAVLTQNTAWTNVERALQRLRDLDALAPEAILALPMEGLAEALRPAGYFNVKARRLSAFCQHYVASGGFEALSALETAALRRSLLDVNGVGPETADDMLLYAFERPVFVVDAYTRRIFSRLGLLDGDEVYEAIRKHFESALGPDVPLFNEYHALVVRHGKEVCKTRPNCAECVLRSRCPAA
ncbi:endonuclease III domain-containing protein [Thiorhodococcus mannitoliphagus]|uniref:Endonuclease III domain-containing protein n=1 Tax=Thiorhodococcus mannitoliphagus TaxID=329406 RepID=A0A6P1DT25_9GAMM|nr:endonuclease III domain-containing protein [Thiorhodococcus mannitoliphagus]NEX20091.1 endonuclease III domain-containing protein [Thiorhodococcus mannitoliphagus]